MKIKIKDWWYKQEQSKAQRYDWTLCWEYLFKDKDGILLNIPESIGKNMYSAGEADYAGYALFGEKVRETEKAVQFRLKYWNLRKAGRYVNDAPVEDKWLTWIPKSVML